MPCSREASDKAVGPEDKLNRAQLRLLKEEVLKRKWTKIGLKVDEMSPTTTGPKH